MSRIEKTTYRIKCDGCGGEVPHNSDTIPDAWGYDPETGGEWCNTCWRVVCSFRKRLNKAALQRAQSEVKDAQNSLDITA